MTHRLREGEVLVWLTEAPGDGPWIRQLNVHVDPNDDQRPVPGAIHRDELGRLVLVLASAPGVLISLNSDLQQVVDDDGSVRFELREGTVSGTMRYVLTSTETEWNP